MLHVGAAMQQLKLINCALLDGTAALAAVLPQLPNLQHLVFHNCVGQETFPGHVLPQLGKLTHLDVTENGDAPDSTVLPRIQTLTALQHLYLQLPEDASGITADSLAGLQHLTQLSLHLGMDAESHPAALTGKTQLQHLELQGGNIAGQEQGAAALLSEVRTLQQLTSLNLGDLLQWAAPSLTAYSALTASSCLRTLDFSDWCSFDVDDSVWQHIFPVGRQRPILQVLLARNLSNVLCTAPAIERMVSCCPNLRRVILPAWTNKAEQLAPLRGLANLQDLMADMRNEAAVGVVAQLTALRRLLTFGDITMSGLLQLTQLQQLTQLVLIRGVASVRNTRRQSARRRRMQSLKLCCKPGSGELPVWRQIRQYCLDHGSPEVVQQAQLAAGLQEAAQSAEEG